MWARLKHWLGLDVRARLRAVELRVAHNEGAIQGAVAAFRQFAEGAKK